NVRDLAGWIAQNVRNPLRVTLYGSGAVAIAANTETVLARDLHQIGGLAQQARNFLVLQKEDASIQLYRVSFILFACATRRMSVTLRVLLFVLLLVPKVCAQAPFTVVSGASYQNTVAPDSLATIFGTNLALATASASLDANGQLPTEL